MKNITAAARKTFLAVSMVVIFTAVFSVGIVAVVETAFNDLEPDHDNQ